MKRSLLFFTVLLLCSFTLKQGGLRTDEKAFLIAQLEETKANLQKSVEGLTEAQLQYTPDTSRWSISQCLEHIALAERGLFSWEQQVMSMPANPDKRKEIKVTDEGLVTMINDRSKKAQAPEMIRPHGVFASADEALKAFIARRDSTIDYVRNTTDDLRSHVAEGGPLGPIDAYQLLLLISAHSSRHTKQIEEMKGDAGYPK